MSLGWAGSATLRSPTDSAATSGCLTLQPSRAATVPAKSGRNPAPGGLGLVLARREVWIGGESGPRSVVRRSRHFAARSAFVVSTNYCGTFAASPGLPQSAAKLTFFANGSASLEKGPRRSLRAHRHVATTAIHRVSRPSTAGATEFDPNTDRAPCRADPVKSSSLRVLA